MSTKTGRGFGINIIKREGSGESERMSSQRARFVVERRRKDRKRRVRGQEGSSSPRRR